MTWRVSRHPHYDGWLPERVIKIRMAAGGGYQDLALMALKGGADIYPLNTEGRPALITAVRPIYPRIIASPLTATAKASLENGANVHASDNSLRNVLIHAETAQPILP